MPEVHVPNHARTESIVAALLAVTAAIATVVSNKTTNDALNEKNNAILLRTQASDSYNAYEARQIKEQVFRAAFESNASGPAAVRSRLQAAATAENAELPSLLQKGRTEEGLAAAANAKAVHYIHAHEVMDAGIAAIEVAIAVVSIAAVTASGSLLWFGVAAAICGLAGVIYGVILR